MHALRCLLKAVLPAPIRHLIRGWIEGARMAAIQQALQQQGLFELYERLVTMVPDIRDQVTAYKLDTPLYYERHPEFLELGVRALHAFQISLVEQALALLQLEASERTLTIVDVGDSAGTHVQYLRALHQNIRSLSVNIDEQAVRRIRQKGLEAVHASAEELEYHEIRPDIFLSFEMLEHLPDPCRFLRNLSRAPSCLALIVTVPYVAQSRVGLQYIRLWLRQPVSAEGVHIFELSPEDWRLLFKFSGWRVVKDQIYHQYPRFRPLHIMKPLLRARDFEGYYGAILVRDLTWSDLYRAGSMGTEDVYIQPEGYVGASS